MAKISVVVDAYNKEKDLPRCLNSVKGLADEILVCDEESTDNTVGIAKAYGARVVTHKTVPYVELIRNFEVSKASGDWILVLDPDEEVPKTLATHLLKVVKTPKADYYRLPRKNMIFGKWMRYSRWWPDYNIRFFKKGKVSWSEEIHAVPITLGKGADMPEKEELAIVHHHYDSIEQYIERMNRYTLAQAEMKIGAGYKFTWSDLIRKPAAEFLSRYFSGQGYKDGVHGLALSLLQAFSELVLYLKVWQKEKFRQEDPGAKEVVATMTKEGKELRYWQADAMLRETGNIFYRIRRKLKI